MQIKFTLAFSLMASLLLATSCGNKKENNETEIKSARITVDNPTDAKIHFVLDGKDTIEVAAKTTKQLLGTYDYGKHTLEYNGRTDSFEIDYDRATLNPTLSQYCIYSEIYLATSEDKYSGKKTQNSSIKRERSSEEITIDGKTIQGPIYQIDSILCISGEHYSYDLEQGFPEQLKFPDNFIIQSNDSWEMKKLFRRADLIEYLAPHSEKGNRKELKNKLMTTNLNLFYGEDSKVDE